MVVFFAIRCIRMFSFFMRQPPFGLLGEPAPLLERRYYLSDGATTGATASTPSKCGRRGRRPSSNEKRLCGAQPLFVTGIGFVYFVMKFIYFVMKSLTLR